MFCVRSISVIRKRYIEQCSFEVQSFEPFEPVYGEGFQITKGMKVCADMGCIWDSKDQNAPIFKQPFTAQNVEQAIDY